MQITIDESEIIEAITQYITAQGFLRTDAEVSISLTAGRGANGHSATIDVTKIQIQKEKTIPSHNTKQEPFHIPNIEEKPARKTKTKTVEAEPADTEVERLLEEAEAEKPKENVSDELLFDNTETEEEAPVSDIESLFSD